MAAVKSAQVIRGIQPHTSNPCWPLLGLLLKSPAFIFITITGRVGWDSGRSLCTRQSAHSHHTTMELACGQGRLRLDKYASMPQRRCSYFHRFVWECKFMCVIPVYYMSASGQNENEYSHMHALAHTYTAGPLKKKKKKSINTERVVLSSLHTVCCRWCKLWADAGWSRSLICNIKARSRFCESECVLSSQTKRPFRLL